MTTAERPALGDSTSDERSLVEVARLLGRLLLIELDEATLARLGEEELSAALAELGVEVPRACGRQALDHLAAEFYAVVLQPAELRPLVQSLWTGGGYEGDAAVAVRKLAEAAGLEFQKTGARGAPNDHLGSLLLLWAETRLALPEVAERVEQEHLQWALAPLDQLARGEGFYPSVAAATAAWIRTVT